jgi:hypothetical protein
MPGFPERPSSQHMHHSNRSLCSYGSGPEAMVFGLNGFKVVNALPHLTISPHLRPRYGQLVRPTG